LPFRQADKETIPEPWGALGMTPDEQLMRVKRSRRAAIICMAAATACFMVSLHFSELDVSELKPVTTEPQSDTV
jgi:hypothetical protein